MNYHLSDIKVRVGDIVRYAGRLGIIAFIIDDGCYSEAFPKADWSYLGRGLGIHFQEGAWIGRLIHLHSSDEEEDLELEGI